MRGNADQNILVSIHANFGGLSSLSKTQFCEAAQSFQRSTLGPLNKLHTDKNISHPELQKATFCYMIILEQNK